MTNKKEQIEIAQDVQETMKTTKKRAKFVKTKLIFFVLLMGSTFCLFYFMTPILYGAFSSFHPVSFNASALSKMPRKVMPIKTPDYVVEDGHIFAETAGTADVNMEVIEADVVGSTVDSIDIQPESELTPTEMTQQMQEIPPIFSEIMADAEQEQADLQAKEENQPMRYSILKAMQLRDAIKQGEQCRPLLEELVTMPNKTPQIDQALLDLLQACLDRPVAGQMRKAFYQAKKRAVLRIFQNDNSFLMAYLKAVPYFIANISMKHPAGDTPMDILNRLQQAVDSDRPHLVLKLIPELPPNVQTIFYDVRQYASHEAAIHQSFNRLMQALFKQGGNND